MNKENLKSTLLSLGAFIPEKFNPLFSVENAKIGEEVFREYPTDISLSTGGLYVARRLPVDKYWAALVKEHFTKIKDVQPQNGIEMNNKAFGYSECGFYRDFLSDKETARIIDSFEIDIREVIRIFEESYKLNPELWEPHYNIASDLISLYTWGDNPEQDRKDQERAFKELRTVLEIDPNNIPARLKLASFYRDYVDPHRLCREVLKLDPNNKEAKEEIEMLNSVGWRFEEHSGTALEAALLEEAILLKELAKRSKDKNSES